MRLSRKILLQRFKKFNEKYFENELVTPKFVINGSRWTAGMFNCDVMVETNERGKKYATELRDIKIRLSKHLIKNSRILDNILLHEMIHYYFDICYPISYSLNHSHLAISKLLHLSYFV